MKKISYYAVLIVVFFLIFACKTGEINMPKTSKSASSSAKINQIEEISEKEIAKQPQPHIITETDLENKTDKTEFTTIEELPDEITLETTEPEKEKEVFESVSVAEPETTAKMLHVPEVEKNEAPAKLSTDPKTESIVISDKKFETTKKTEAKPAVKQEKQTQKNETMQKNTSTVNKTTTTAKKTEPAPKTETIAESVTKNDGQNVKKEEEIQPVVKKDNKKNLNIVPSRTIEIGLNQYLDVFYPGAGWVYLGEQDESVSLLSFFDRNLDENDTKFILRAKKPGTAILHFYKQDLLTDTYIDDYLKVIVNTEKYKGKDHSVAPSYAAIVPPNQQKYIAMAESAQNDMNFIPPADNEIVEKTIPTATQNEPAINLKDENIILQRDESDLKEGEKRATSTIIKDDTTQISSTQITGSDTTSVKKDYTADELLALAKKAKDEKRYNDSLDLLNLFFEKAVSSLDEGWFLKGQLYEETDADFKNIRTSLESYQILVDRYPSSRLWKAANERINYINRFYFKIR